MYLTQPIEWPFENSEKPIREAGYLKFCAPFNEWARIGPSKYGYSKCEKKSGLRRKLKVSTLDIQIKQSIKELN